LSASAKAGYGVPAQVGQANLPPVCNLPPAEQVSPLFFWIASLRSQ